ncbi:MAG TPA: aspartate kinase [Vicinamibacteria bacterium]|nr:aspartate kinase [Vicinamibacteria bacterium]
MGGLKRRVLKFGGTSVGTPPALRSALAIAEAAARERPIVVVVSALSGVTDALEAALAGAAAGRLDISAFAAAVGARHLSLLAAVAQGKPAVRASTLVRERLGGLEARLRSVAAGASFSAATRAAVLAVGERACTPIVEAALRARGIEAHALDGASLLRTDEAFAEAAVDRAATRRLARTAVESLGPHAVPVVTGFVAGTESGETTLLGRGGSDLTAAVLGWALEAERVEIWSDVDGMMTADPRVDRGARRFERLSYAEATALARAGAKVLHPRTLEPLEGAGIPVFVGNTLRPGGPGTWIGPGETGQEAEEAGTAA